MMTQTQTSGSVTHNSAASRFEMNIDGALAVADYRLDGKVAAFTHTEVPPALRGRGIATRLIAAALDEAQSRGWQVVPLCSAVAVYIERHPERRALLKPRD